MKETAKKSRCRIKVRGSKNNLVNSVKIFQDFMLKNICTKYFEASTFNVETLLFNVVEQIKAGKNECQNLGPSNSMQAELL